MEVISSTKNDRIKNAAALQKSKKARTEQGLFAAEGLRIADDTFKSAAGLIDSVFVSESFLKKRAWEGYPAVEKVFSAFADKTGVSNGGAEDQRTSYPDMIRTGKDSEARLFVVKDTVFEGMCETVTPQGILCLVKQPEYSYEDIVKGSDIKLLLLEDIQDPGNLGTMIRTAEAAGMNGLIMSRGTVDIFSPKVTRSTMGAIFRVPFLYTDSLTDTIDRLKNDGVTVYAAYLRDGEDFENVSYSSRSAVMIGNEGNGLSDAAVEHASKNVYIPMAGEVESLNAAVAAALLMYKIR